MIPHELGEYNIQYLWVYPKYEQPHHPFEESYYHQNVALDSFHESKPNLADYFIKHPVRQDENPHHKNFASHLREFLYVLKSLMYDQITLDEVHTKQH